MDPNTLVGLPEQAAVACAQQHNFNTKIVNANAPSLLTADYRRDRITLKVSNGLVVGAYFG